MSSTASRGRARPIRPRCLLEQPLIQRFDVVPTELRYSFRPNLLGQRRLARIGLAAI
jgi:hypothetical protein